MDTTAISRKERERARHREEILKAALSLFSQKGFYNVSMREIADKSEFAIGTLYNFFANKDSLFENLLDHYGQRIVEDVSALLEGPANETELLAGFIRCQPDILEKYSEVLKVYSMVFGSRGTAIAKIRDKSKIKDILTSKITLLIERGIQKGLFRAVDPTITAMSVSAIFETMAFELAGRFDKPKAIEMFQKVEQLIVGGLLLPEARTLE